MKLYIKVIVSAVLMAGLSFSCEDFLDESPNSQIDGSTFYTDLTTAEIGLTGCYNRFFDQNAYSYMTMLTQVSTDDILQPSGAFHLYKDREAMNSVDVVGNPWIWMYRVIANVNFLLQEVEALPDAAFGDKVSRKDEILAEAHFLRGVAYYYLGITWGAVPIIDQFPDDIEEVFIDKSSRDVVMAFAKTELELAEAGLPNIISTYDNDQVTNQRKGRASKWAAKAYLARMAMEDGDMSTALTKVNEIIDSGLYPLASVWSSIFTEPGNSSESIFEQQNDYSPGFFGSGLYGWFFGYDFEWSADALSIFEKPADVTTEQGIDVRFSYAYTPHPWAGTYQPNKYLPSRGYADGGVEQMNLVIIRLSEMLLIKAEILNEQDFAGNKNEVISILNAMRARAEEASFSNAWLANAPDGTIGIPPFVDGDFNNQDQLRQAIREEKRRELMFEDVIRWIDLYRWDKDYLKTITNSSSDDHLFWPVPPDEIIRNPNLTQNPAYADSE